MFNQPEVQRDFRIKGYAGQNMFSPRVPVVAPSPSKRELEERELLKYFGKSSQLDPSKPRVDENHRGMLYGDHDYDRGHPHPRPMQDPFRDRGNEDLERFQKEKRDMEADIKAMKEKQMREKSERDFEKKQNYEILTKQFPWDKNKGHGAPRGSGSNRRRKFLETDFTPRHQEGYKDKRETDLFLDTLGGPGGTVVRGEDRSPPLADPKFQQQQQNYQQGMMNSQTPRMTPRELQEYSKKLDEVSTERRMAKNQHRMHELRNQIDEYQNTNGYQPSQESKIREDFSSRNGFNDFKLEEDTSPYYPWGGQGGGAPIRDRDGNVRTMIYGKLGGRETEDNEVRKTRRRQEVLYNELKEGDKQFKSKRDELNRFMKAPQADVAEVLLAGRVGKPKRDAITGEIGQHHLGNSDVSKIKMNYQPVEDSEKRKLHNDLLEQANERRHERELEKRKERQESNAHFNNMDRLWGHQGGGAPKDRTIRKKANLTNSLFYPDATPITETVASNGNTVTSAMSPLPSYQKLYVDGDARQYPPSDQSPRYIKSTLQSSHKNGFDSNPEYRFSEQKPRQKYDAPYATGAGLF